MLRLTRKAQSTAEYAIVIGLVLAAVLGMQVYVKRGIQGKIRDAVDYSPDKGKIFTTGYLYEPYYSSSSMDTVRNGSQSIETKSKGEVVRVITGAGEVTNRNGTQSVSGAQ